MTCPRLFDHRRSEQRGDEVFACVLKAGHKHRVCLMNWRPATEAEVTRIQGKRKR